MAKVETTLNYIEIEGDYGLVEGVELTCSKCLFAVESAGTHSGSIARCAFLLRENCPHGESNFYVTD